MDAWISNWRKHLVQARRKKGIILYSITLVVLITSLGLITYSWAQKDLTIIDNGKEINVKTFTKDVKSLFEEQGIALADKDEISCALTTPLQDGMTVSITRAFPIIVKVDGKETRVDTIPVKVGELLEQAEVALNPEDEVIPALNEELNAPGQVVIKRVTFEEVVIEKELPFKTERESHASLDKGVTKLLREGQNGLEKRIVKVTYKDGQEVKREEVEREVVKEPVHKRIAYGTRSTISRGGQDLRFSRSLQVAATAYTHTGNRTYSGTVPQRGTIAVDPKVIPLGTKLYVEGYGHGRALDIGSAIKGPRIDVFVDSEREARIWGRKRVKVYVLE